MRSQIHFAVTVLTALVYTVFAAGGSRSSMRLTCDNNLAIDPPPGTWQHSIFLLSLLDTSSLKSLIILFCCAELCMDIPSLQCTIYRWTGIRVAWSSNRQLQCVSISEEGRWVGGGCRCAHFSLNDKTRKLMTKTPRKHSLKMNLASRTPHPRFYRWRC